MPAGLYAVPKVGKPSFRAVSPFAPTALDVVDIFEIDIIIFSCIARAMTNCYKNQVDGEPLTRTQVITDCIILNTQL